MTKSPYMLALGGLFAMAAGVGIGRFVYTPILPPMVEALHLTKSQAGLIASANFVGYFAGALLAALRLPGTRRLWLLGALAASTLCLAGMGETTNLALFLFLRLIAGVASAFILIFASALVLDRLAREGRSGLSALHFAGVGSGIAASSVLVACFSDWHEMWIASAVLSLAASLAVLFLVPAEPGAGQRAAAQTRTKFPPGFAALAIAYGLFGFGYVITATFIVAMVRGTPAIANLEPYIFVMFGLSAAPSVALWTRLGTRWGVLRAFMAAAIVEAAGVAASALWVNEATVIAASLLVGGTFMGLTALGLIGARQLGGPGGEGDPRGRIALVTAAFSFGQILGPSFAGYVYDATGNLAVPSLAAAIALVVAAALSALASRQ
jgi:predicted MFS family arabinose efflux permease